MREETTPASLATSRKDPAACSNAALQRHGDGEGGGGAARPRVAGGGEGGFGAGEGAREAGGDRLGKGEGLADGLGIRVAAAPERAVSDEDEATARPTTVRRDAAEEGAGAPGRARGTPARSATILDDGIASRARACATARGGTRATRFATRPRQQKGAAG